MKYIWKNMTDDDKWAAVAEELRLVTHMGTTKDDLVEIMKFLNTKLKEMDEIIDFQSDDLVSARNERDKYKARAEIAEHALMTASSHIKHFMFSKQEVKYFYDDYLAKAKRELENAE